MLTYPSEITYQLKNFLQKNNYIPKTKYSL